MFYFSYGESLQFQIRLVKSHSSFISLLWQLSAVWPCTMAD